MQVSDDLDVISFSLESVIYAHHFTRLFRLVFWMRNFSATVNSEISTIYTNISD